MKNDKLINRTKDITLMGLFTAILIVCSQIIIPLPFSPVPFSLSLLAIFLAGGVLEKNHAFFALLVYVVLGAFGAPVFAGFKSGIGTILGPTGGYIIAYPIMGYLISLIGNRKKGKAFINMVIGMVVALAILYVLGTTWLSFVAQISISKAVMVGVAPFVIFDIIKICIGVILTKLIKKHINHSSFLK